MYVAFFLSPPPLDTRTRTVDTHVLQYYTYDTARAHIQYFFTSPLFLSLAHRPSPPNVRPPDEKSESATIPPNRLRSSRERYIRVHACTLGDGFLIK